MLTVPDLVHCPMCYGLGSRPNHLIPSWRQWAVVGGVDLSWANYPARRRPCMTCSGVKQISKADAAELILKYEHGQET